MAPLLWIHVYIVFCSLDPAKYIYFYPHLHFEVFFLYRYLMTSKKVTHFIRNCSWKFKCDKTWDSLLPTKPYTFESTRYCPDCKENVRLVNSESSLFLAIEHNQCVSIPLEITNVYKQSQKHLMGSIKMAQKING